MNLTPPTYLSQVKLFLTLFIVATISVVTIAFIFEGITYQSLLFSVAYVAGSGFVMYFVCKHSQTASIKGDSLILNALNKRSTVMSIKGIKKIKARSLLFVYFTSMHYNLDGRMKTIYFVTQSLDSTAPEKTVKIILKDLKGKKKANHKPGSVFAHQA